MTATQAQRLAARVEESGYLAGNEYVSGRRIRTTGLWAVEIWALPVGESCSFGRRHILTSPEQWTHLATVRGGALAS